MAERVQMTRKRPWRADHPDAVIVDRRTPWGNTWTMEDAKAHRVPVALRQQWLVDQFRREVDAILGSDNEIHDRLGYPPNILVSEIIAIELCDRDLACWCPLDQPCHADVLLELANAREDRGQTDG